MRWASQKELVSDVDEWGGFQQSLIPFKFPETWLEIISEDAAITQLQREAFFISRSELK